ncbi:MAG: adenine-specific DNA methylase [Elusimicrobia bacterium]|nr:MAG: adenine-specific DNA methylase [Elusimicrobiota bacterium]
MPDVAAPGISPVEEMLGLDREDIRKTRLRLVESLVQQIEAPASPVEEMLGAEGVKPKETPERLEAQDVRRAATNYDMWQSGRLRLDPDAAESLRTKVDAFVEKRVPGAMNAIIGPESAWNPKATPNIPAPYKWPTLGKKGFVEAVGETSTKDIPIAGLGVSLGEAWRTKEAVNTYLNYQKTGEWPKGTSWLSPGDAKWEILNTKVKLDYLNSRGYTLPGTVGKILVPLAGFMAEFAVTGGVAAPFEAGGRALTKKAMQRFGESYLKRTLIRGVGEIGAATVGGLARAGTIGQFRALAGTVQRTTPEVAEGGAGQLVEVAPAEGLASAYTKSFGDAWIQYATEGMGGPLTKTAGRLLGRVPGAARVKAVGALARSALNKVWKTDGVGREALRRVLVAGGYSSSLGEELEERIADPLGALFNTQPGNFGLTEDQNTLKNRMWEALTPDAKQVLAELIAFTVPGVAGQVVSRVAGGQQQPNAAEVRKNRLKVLTESGMSDKDAAEILDVLAGGVPPAAAPAEGVPAVAEAAPGVQPAEAPAAPVAPVETAVPTPKVAEVAPEAPGAPAPARKPAAEMNPEELAQGLLTHPESNLPNARAFAEATPGLHSFQVNLPLKPVNDRFEHDAGDAVLKAAGEAAPPAGPKATTYDLHGGNLVIEGGDRKVALAAAEKVKAAVEALPNVQEVGGKVTITEGRAEREKFPKRVEQMTPAERLQAYTHNVVSGLRGGVLMRETPEKGGAAAIDIVGLGATSKKYGREAGDAAIRAIAKVATRLKLDIFHPHGDEFVVDAATEAEAENQVGALTKALKRVRLVGRVNGKPVRLKVEVTHAVARTRAEADRLATLAKREAKAARAEAQPEGVQPPGDRGVPEKGGPGVGERGPGGGERGAGRGVVQGEVAPPAKAAVEPEGERVYFLLPDVATISRQLQALGLPSNEAPKLAGFVHRAIADGDLAGLRQALHPANKTVRRWFNETYRVKLPIFVKATNRFVEDWLVEKHPAQRAAREAMQRQGRQATSEFGQELQDLRVRAGSGKVISNALKDATDEEIAEAYADRGLGSGDLATLVAQERAERAIRKQEAKTLTYAELLELRPGAVLQNDQAEKFVITKASERFEPPRGYWEVDAVKREEELSAADEWKRVAVEAGPELPGLAEQPAPAKPEAPAPAAEKRGPAEPAFKVGDGVQWTDSQGKEQTGVVRGVEGVNVRVAQSVPSMAGTPSTRSFLVHSASTGMKVTRPAETVAPTKAPAAPMSEEELAKFLEGAMTEGAEKAEPKGKLAAAAEKARKEAEDALDELGDYTRGKVFANPMFDPKLMGLVAKVSAKLVKAGTLTFADYAVRIAEKIGREMTLKIAPALEAAWAKLHALDQKQRVSEAGPVGPVGKVAEALGEEKPAEPAPPAAEAKPPELMTPSEYRTARAEASAASGGDYQIAANNAPGEHRRALTAAQEAGRPILAKAWDAYRGKEPEGYTLQGDQYVKGVEAPPLTKPAERGTVTREGETRGEVEGGPAGTAGRPEGRADLEVGAAEPGARPGEVGDAVRPAVRGGGEYGQPHGEADLAGGERGRGAEYGGEGVPRPAGLSRKATEAAPGTNYRITNPEAIGKGGRVQQFERNLKAIKLLKKIEGEGRLATPDEQNILAQFYGFGALPQVFDETKADWSDRRAKLKEATTPEEYAALRRSTINAHFTDPEYVGAIWKGLVALGFKGGKIVEPGMGSGIFFGMMPDDVAQVSRLAGVEMDPLTGRLAKQLYQNADIQVAPFQDVGMPDNHYDLFISNVPFADVKVTDNKDRELNKLRASLHDYFFAKALKKTRPGGLVAFITSRYSLDKLDSGSRRYWADHANLVGAIRLPYTAFKGKAGTEVVTDIVVLQKRAPGTEPAGPEFQKRVDVEQGGKVFPVNEYFAEHPEDILGTLDLSGTMYGGKEVNVEPVEDMDLAAEIARRMEAMKDRVNGEALDHVAAETDRRDSPRVIEDAGDTVHDGNLAVVDGKVYRKEGPRLVEQEAPKIGAQARVRRVQALMGVRDAVNRLLALQVSPQATDAQVEAARKKLNAVYDAAVKKYGYLSAQANKQAFKEDDHYGRLRSLEYWDQTTKTATKADVFSKRTQQPHQAITRAENAPDALAASLTERGRVDLGYMHQLTGITPPELAKQLRGMVYQTPTGDFQTRDQYLSGNVRRKLAEAQAASDHPEFSKLSPDEVEDMKRNVEALKAIQPADVPPGQISVRVGSPWIPQETYAEFLKHITGEYATVRRIEATGGWGVTASDYGPGNRSTWGTEHMAASEIINRMMNHGELVIGAKDDVTGKFVVNQEATALVLARADKIAAEFTRWLWSDDARATAHVRKYNDEFNNTVHPRYDGQHLRLPGLATTFQPRPLQKDAIWRQIQGNTLLWHEVGFGKTFEMAGAAMEMRRLGLATKPIFVVPNHLVDQWPSEFLRLYPAAKILKATKKDFEPLNRKTLMNRIATGDWDAVIVPMTSFEKIPMSPARTQAFFDRQIAELEVALQEAKAAAGPQYGKRSRKRSRDRSVKQLEKAKERLKARLDQQLARWKKDSGPFFDELGADALFVDEAHNYKNLWFATKMGRVAGVSPRQTQRSFDMLQKTEYVNELNGGRGVIFGTGTPITNSITEVYTMQRYLQPGMLKDRKVEAFDSWADNFGQVVHGAEVTPTGSGFRMHSRFSKFVNLPELMQMLRMVADVRTVKEANIEVPEVEGGKARPIVLERSPEQAAYIADLDERVEAIRTGNVDPKVDNMLNVTTDGTKVALDPRLVGINTDRPDSKVNTAAGEVFDTWKATARDKLAQVIWCDLGLPNKEGRFSVYDDLKAKLVARGIPAKQIAYALGATDSATKREALFSDIRTGRVRVIIASTQKLGTGANIQDKLVRAHHLDAPWRPADIEQREGRMVRYGNQNKRVSIATYLTNKSFDAYRWQTLETKAKAIFQLMRGDSTLREIEDVGGNSLEYGEFKALASGNPKIMEFVKLDASVRRLAAERAGFLDEAWQAKRDAQSLPEIIQSTKKHLAEEQRAADAFKAARAAAGDKVPFALNGTEYEKRADANTAINKAATFVKAGGKEVAGTIYGLPFVIKRGITGGLLTFEIEEKIAEIRAAGAPVVEAARQAWRNFEGTVEETQALYKKYQDAVVAENEKSYALETGVFLEISHGTQKYNNEASLLSTSDNLKRLQNLLDKPAEKIDALTRGLAEHEAELKQVQAKSTGEWDKEAEFGQKQEELAKLTAELQLDRRGPLDVGTTVAEEKKQEEDEEEEEKGLEGEGEEAYIPPEMMSPREVERIFAASRAEQAGPPVPAPPTPTPVPVSAQPTAEPISRHAIAAEIERLFETPIRVGGFRKKAAGIFKGQPEVIRVKGTYVGHLGVITHELFHAIGKLLGKFQHLPLDASRELIALDYQPGRADRTIAKREGFSEWGRHLLTMDDAAEVAPVFYRYWTGLLDVNPDLAAKLDQVKALVDQWRREGALGRARADFSRTGKPFRAPGETRLAEAVEVTKTNKDRFIAAVKDAAIYMRRMQKALIAKGMSWEPGESPEEKYNAYLNAAGSYGERAITDGVFSLKDLQTKLGPGVEEIIAKLGPEVSQSDLDDAELYAWARHSIESWAHDKNPGMDLADAQEIVRQLQTPEREAFADGIRDINNALVTMLQESGVLSTDEAGAILSTYQTYVPLQRVMDKKTPAMFGGRGFANLPQAIKRRIGSGRAIISPLESTIARTYQFYDRAMKQDVISTLYHAVKQTGGLGGWMEVVPPDMRRAIFSGEEIKAQLEKAGVDADALASLPDEAKIFAYRPDYTPRGGKPIVRIVDEGKTVMLQLDPDLYRFAAAMDIYRLPGFLDKTFGLATRVLRLGATGLAPAFALRNIARDYVTYLMQRRPVGVAAAPRSAIAPLEALASYAASEVRRLAGGTEDPLVKIYRDLGGLLSTTMGLDYRMIDQKVKQMLGDDLWVKSKRVILNSPDTLRELVSFTEIAPRLAEFANVLRQRGWTRERIKREGLPPKAVLIEAIGAAHDVTVDFRRMGYYGKIANQMIPFFNANLEGQAKIVRFARANPRAAALRVSAMVMAAALYWALRHDDDDYKEQPAWLKYGFWTVTNDQDEAVARIPKTYGWGAISSFVEAMLNRWLDKDPKAMGEFSRELLKQQLPPVVPAAIGPPAEVYFNYDTFRQRPIVSERLESRLPADQFTPHNTALAKAIGRWLDVSPAKVEHLFSGYTGGLYRGVVRPVEGALGYGERVRTADLPFVSAFSVQYEPSGSEDRFYTAVQEAQQVRNSAKDRGEIPYDVAARAAHMADLSQSAGKLRDMNRGVVGREERFRVEKYLIGLARLGTGEPPLSRYPNLFAAADLDQDIQAIRDKEVVSKAEVLSRAPPLGAKAGKSEATRRAEWEQDQRLAADFLQYVQADPGMVRAVFARHLAATVKDPVTRQRNFERFTTWWARRMAPPASAAGG